MVGEFVGRTRELEAISASLAAAAREQRPRVVLLAGEPGIGKTRRLGEVRAGTPAGRTFAVEGYEPERSVPLAAAAALVRSLTGTSRSSPFGDVLTLDATGEARSLDPIRIFETAHRAIDRLGTVAIVVDDLQWVDELS